MTNALVFQGRTVSISFLLCVKLSLVECSWKGVHPLESLNVLCKFHIICPLYIYSYFWCLWITIAIKNRMYPLRIMHLLNNFLGSVNIQIKCYGNPTRVSCCRLKWQTNPEASPQARIRCNGAPLTALLSDKTLWKILSCVWTFI